MTSSRLIKRKDLLYPELSYNIIGVLLEVNKNLGNGHQEKHYQKAVAEEFKKRGIKFQEQVPINLVYKDKKVGIYFADFLIEKNIILELKADRFFSRKNIEQVYSYLKALNLKLGILANFTRNGLEYKRIVNVI
jgi:GxxExxY protein